ncbi:MAG TPA: EcsC family protein [Pirellulales bacterium]|jgi:hypothetical protein|nr:EcsC family protein [Pirellulales bacterium]
MATEIRSRLTPAEDDFLRAAALYLDRPSLLIRIANLVGKPIEGLLRLLPEAAHRSLGDAARHALDRAMQWAARSLPPEKAASTSRLRQFIDRHGHTTMTATTGAVGGAFGWAGLPLEVPVTTMLMLRSIAKVARAEGADLSDPATRLQCLAVFSLGSQGPLDAMESAYLSSRVALAVALRDAATFLARHSLAEVGEAWLRESSPALVRLAALIASRFEITLSEKAAAQMVPVAGAAMGALINAAFTDHFNRVAHFHFGILKLERLHGAETVQNRYLALAQQIHE